MEQEAPELIIEEHIEQEPSEQVSVDTSEPVVEETTEQVTEPVVEETTEQVTEPVVEETTEPVVEETTEPVVEQATEPVVEQATEPVVEQATEPVVEQATEPVVEQAPEPVVEEAAEPVVEQVTEPVVEETAEPVAEETTEPVVEQVTEPVVEETAEPVAEETTEPVAEETTEPVVEQAPEPVVEIAPEPVVEQAPEPVVETAPEPVVEQVTEPVVEIALEPVAEETPEPVVEIAPEPVIEIAPEAVAEETPEPVVEQSGCLTPCSGTPQSTTDSEINNVVQTEEFAMDTCINTIPEIVFIVPYRDREQQLIFFKNHMSNILKDVSNYKIYFIHQCDTRPFNRGAMKNIGFLMVKERYPNDYKNITLVFNDVDIMPLNPGFIDYQTTAGKIKHFYGFTHTLGGIVSIKAGDFEATAGFPNLWAWGYEDNMLQYRALQMKLEIDRSRFYPIMDKNFILLHSGPNRDVNKAEFERYMSGTKEGAHSIQNINYTVDEDNQMVNVTNFDCDAVPTPNTVHNLANGQRPFAVPAKRPNRMRMAF